MTEDQEDEKKDLNNKMDIKGYHFQPLAAEIGSRKVPLIFPSLTYEWNSNPKNRVMNKQYQTIKSNRNKQRKGIN